jgi:hypothetical protein
MDTRGQDLAFSLRDTIQPITGSLWGEPKMAGNREWDGREGPHPPPVIVTSPPGQLQ